MNFSKLFYTTKTIPEDLFIRRLRCSVIGEGMLREGNIYLIDHAIQNMPQKGNVIEIGSYGGLSTNLILYLLKKHKREEPLFNCDPWIYEGYEDYKGTSSEFMDGRNDIERIEYMNYIKQSFINSINFLTKDRLPHTFELKSDVFFQKYTEKQTLVDLFGKEVTLGAPISFAYIDGDHAYNSAKKDFENVAKFLLTGGFVLFDDSEDGSKMGSAKLMKELTKDIRFKLIDKNPNYLFQKIV